MFKYLKVFSWRCHYNDVKFLKKCQNWKFQFTDIPITYKGILTLSVPLYESVIIIIFCIKIILGTV